MGFVAKTLGFGDGENALINLSRQEAEWERDERGVGGWPDFQLTSALSPIPGDQILASTIVAGRPRNWGCIAGMKAEVGFGGYRDSRR
jgi:hypothetical protein